MYKVHYICMPLDGGESFGDAIWVIANSKEEAIRNVKMQLIRLNRSVFVSYVENECGEVV